MVNFPTVLGVSITILCKLNYVSKIVFSKYGGVVVENNVTLHPHF